MSATSSGRPSTSERTCGIDKVTRVREGSDIGRRRVGRERILGCLRMPFFPFLGSLYRLRPRGSAHSVRRPAGEACVGS